MINWQNGVTPINETNMNKLVQEDMITDAYSSSSTYAVGDYCIYENTLYKCTTAISTAEAWNSAHWTEATVIDAIQSLLNIMNPVGTIKMTTINTNPGTYLPGTWVAWGSGRVPVGVDTSQTEFNTVEKTGGEKTHVLTENEMPSHQHGVEIFGDAGGPFRLQYSNTFNRFTTKCYNRCEGWRPSSQQLTTIYNMLYVEKNCIGRCKMINKIYIEYRRK